MHSEMHIAAKLDSLDVWPAKTAQVLHHSPTHSEGVVEREREDVQASEMRQLAEDQQQIVSVSCRA